VQFSHPTRNKLQKFYAIAVIQSIGREEKTDSLTLDEALELEAIGELGEIFTYGNSVITARANGRS
jgi:hypothetical protein